MMLLVHWLLLLLVYKRQMMTVLPGELDAAAIILSSAPVAIPYGLYQKRPFITWVLILFFDQLCRSGLHLLVKDCFE
jgi:hypothetical protein